MNDLCIGYFSKRKRLSMSSDDEDEDVQGPVLKRNGNVQESNEEENEIESSQMEVSHLDKTRMMLKLDRQSINPSYGTDFDSRDNYHEDTAGEALFKSFLHDQSIVEESLVFNPNNVTNTSRFEIPESDDSVWSENSLAVRDVDVQPSTSKVLGGLAESQAKLRESPKWNGSEKGNTDAVQRTKEDVRNELLNVEADLLEHWKELSFAKMATLPDKGRRISDSILSLELIKGELISELQSLCEEKSKIAKTENRASASGLSEAKFHVSRDCTPILSIPKYPEKDSEVIDVSNDSCGENSFQMDKNSLSLGGSFPSSHSVKEEKVSRNDDVGVDPPYSVKRHSTPIRSDSTFFKPVKQELPVFDVSDDDCVMVEEKFSPTNQNAGSSGISIANNRGGEKEKISHNSSNIINSPVKEPVASAAWSNLTTPESAKEIQGLGKQAMQTFTAQQSLTVETLHTLHSALKACPTEDKLEDDPKGLKVELMPHQKHALAWLLWREREKPSGGLLADDMGLGKTLTMISLVLKSMQIKEKENAGRRSSDNDADEWFDPRHKMPQGGTLVVCPASLVGQWEKEISRRCDRGLLSVLLYHGTNRETRVKRIARKDVVITTYNLIGRESGVDTAKDCAEIKSPGPLHCIKWERIILDEAHIVRNHKSQTAIGVFALPGKHRWCLTGTPIQNKELDLFALLKFLKCSPFDDLLVWKRWVDNKNAAGMQRLATMMKSLMLRRTKQQLQEKGGLQDLPTKEYELISVKLDKEELKLYEKIALFSGTLFMQFLAQRAEKNQANKARLGQNNRPAWEQGDRLDNQFFTNEEAVEMYRRMKFSNSEIKTHHILVLLLRLRQICCHPGLIKEMLQKEDFSEAGIDDEMYNPDDDLFRAMAKLGLDETAKDVEEDWRDPNSASPPRGVSALSPENPILQFNRPSSKIRAVLDVILDKVLISDDKAVVVSQWTSMLNIVRDHLRDMGVTCEMFCGSVPVSKRMEIVDDFNSKKNKFKVLLLSLTAGGVGLNLVGGNHLFLMDVHWNPQWEAQACDRIYRVGQTKPVFIYKFICSDTIEVRIKALQDHKLSIAESVLTGSKNTQGSKLTLQDLKMLFGIGSLQPEYEV